MDRARFDPFLTSVQAGFTLTGATLQGLAGLIGLGGKPSGAAPPPPPAGGPAQPGVASHPYGHRGNRPPPPLPLRGRAGPGLTPNANFTPPPPPPPPKHGGPRVHPAATPASA